MKNKYKFSLVDKLLIFGLVSPFVIIICAIFIFLIALFMHDDVQDYPTCLEKNYYKENIKHFPKTIPEKAEEIEFYCFPALYERDGSLIMLKYKADKNYIESELKKHEFLNSDEPIGSIQKTYNMHPELVGLEAKDITYYALKTEDNEYAQERGYFPHYTGIGVSNDMNYILYYTITPDD